jgi:hypothetical protein
MPRFLLSSFIFFFISSIYVPISEEFKSSVSVVTRLWAGRPKNRGSILNRDKIFPIVVQPVVVPSKPPSKYKIRALSVG